MNSDVLVIQEQRTHVLWLTINRPALSNALTRQVFEALGAGLDEAEKNHDIRVVVITGAGDKAFSAGADLREDVEGSPFNFNHANAEHPAATYFARAARCTVPIIARVNGHARAGGFGLLCAADLAVMADHAELGLPEVRLGIFPIMFGALMQRLIPARKLNELMLTGRPIGAQEALDMNLVNAVVPLSQLDERLDQLLKQIVNNSPTAIRLGKSAMASIRDMTLEQGLDFAVRAFPTMTMTEDTTEGFNAYRGKRKPDWPAK